MKTHGWEVKSYHLLLHFAHQLGLPVYNKLCEERFLDGEWLFSELLFGDSRKNKKYTEHYASHLRRISESIDRPVDCLSRVKTQMVPEFLNWAVYAFDWGQYGESGFTSTINQNIASITLAKLINEKFRIIVILFGGSK